MSHIATRDMKTLPVNIGTGFRVLDKKGANTEEPSHEDAPGKAPSKTRFAEFTWAPLDNDPEELNRIQMQNHVKSLVHKLSPDQALAAAKFLGMPIADGEDAEATNKKNLLEACKKSIDTISHNSPEHVGILRMALGMPSMQQENENKPKVGSGASHAYHGITNYFDIIGEFEQTCLQSNNMSEQGILQNSESQASQLNAVNAALSKTASDLSSNSGSDGSKGIFDHSDSKGMMIAGIVVAAVVVVVVVALAVCAVVFSGGAAAPLVIAGALAATPYILGGSVALGVAGAGLMAASAGTSASDDNTQVGKDCSQASSDSMVENNTAEVINREISTNNTFVNDITTNEQQMTTQMSQMFSDIEKVDVVGPSGAN